MSRVIYEGDTINSAIEKTATHPFAARLPGDVIAFSEIDNIHEPFKPLFKYRYLNIVI